MIISMTGYGRGDVKTDNKEITVEVRSLNNRFLDITTRLPKNLFIYEEEIKTIIRKYSTRGRISVVINIKEANGNINSLNINSEIAKSYLNILNKLKQDLEIKGEVQLDHLLLFKDIFFVDIEDEIADNYWKNIKIALKQAMENLKQMKIKEGTELGIDLNKRIKIIDNTICEIEVLAKNRINKEYVKLKERIDSINNFENIDEGRLEAEIALIASRIDITEECIRFKSHNKLFMNSIENDDAVGRKLNFLLQEMTREANTIGSKAYDAEISHLVVSIKEEVEKIREQVQNIE